MITWQFRVLVVFNPVRILPAPLEVIQRIVCLARCREASFLVVLRVRRLRIDAQKRFVKLSCLLGFAKELQRIGRQNLSTGVIWMLLQVRFGGMHAVAGRLNNRARNFLCGITLRSTELG
jgi:hypothetical protein